MKKNILSIITISTILTLALIMTGCPTAPSNLSLNLKPGSSYNMDITVNQTISQEMDGEKYNTEMDYTFSYIIEGKDDDKDGNKQIDLTISDMKMNMSNPDLGLTISIDTANPTDDEFSNMLSAITGSKFSFTIDKDGKIINVEGVEDIFDDIKITDDEMGYVVYESLEGIISEDSLKETFGSSTWVTTSEPIKPGYTWEETLVSSKDMPMEIKTTYILNEIKDNLAYISVESDISLADDISEEENILGMSYTISGKQTGDMTVDIDTGLVMDGEISMDITGEISMEFDGTEIKMPMTINTTIIVKTVEN